jgi:hypothetical protein
MNRDLRKELLEMHTRDEDLQKELAGEGPYPERLQALHRRNAERLAEIIEEFGWPVRSLVGEGGMRAAWRIAHNAVMLPDFQRRVLSLLTDAEAVGEVPGWQVGALAERFAPRTHESRTPRD